MPWLPGLLPPEARSRKAIKLNSRKAPSPGPHKLSKPPKSFASERLDSELSASVDDRCEESKQRFPLPQGIYHRQYRHESDRFS